MAFMIVHPSIIIFNRPMILWHLNPLLSTDRCYVMATIYRTQQWEDLLEALLSVRSVPSAYKGEHTGQKSQIGLDTKTY
jgi:hypothetical protein